MTSTWLHMGVKTAFLTVYASVTCDFGVVTLSLSIVSCINTSILNIDIVLNQLPHKVVQLATWHV